MKASTDELGCFVLALVSGMVLSLEFFVQKT